MVLARGMTTSSQQENEIYRGTSVSSQTAQVVQQHPAFEKAILIVICLNAAWIGVDVDWNDDSSPVPQTFFIVGENLFCALFTLELIVRFLAYPRKIHFFTDPDMWKANMFDLILVGLMILEVWILAPLDASSDLDQLTVVRLLRLLRLLRISRIFRMVPELGMMVKNMAKAARSVSTTLLLLVGVIYGFAVILTQWTKSHSNACAVDFDGECALNEFFGSILKSFVTLLQILVFDDSFAIIRPILDNAWYIGCLLVFFMVLGSWTVLNMLIGIICEIVCTGTAEEKMKILEQRVREVFASIDVDGSGTVTRDEFNSAGVMRQLVNLGISKDVMHNAFDILDHDGSGSFSSDEFLNMIFKLLNPPQSQDIQVLNQKMGQMQAVLEISTFRARPSKKLSLRPSVQALQGILRAGLHSHNTPGEQIDDDDPSALHKLRQAACKEASQLPPEDPLGGIGGSWAPDTLELKVENEFTSPDGSEAQAQEIFEKLERLAQNRRQVEEALNLVHGWKSWERNDSPRLEGVLKDVGLYDLPEDDQKKAKGLVREYAALCKRATSSSAATTVTAATKAAIIPSLAPQSPRTQTVARSPTKSQSASPHAPHPNGVHQTGIPRP